MKRNAKKIRTVCIIWAVIGVILLVCIWNSDDSVGEVFKRVVWVYLSISCVLSGIFARLSRKNKDAKENP